MYDALLGRPDRLLQQPTRSAWRRARGRSDAGGNLLHRGRGLQVPLARVKLAPAERDRTQEPGRIQDVGEAGLFSACVAHRVGQHHGDREPVTEREASTAHRILARHRLPALAACDRATGEPVRRYERARPGELVHIDVKKLGRIPDGGGHKTLGRAAGRKNRTGVGHAYLHTALDDHSRLAYTEDLPDEKAITCAAFLTRATAWFTAQGITIERVLTDNAWAYTKNTWRQTCHDLNISPRWTRPWRPQTNGKVERFHLTLLDEWAYHRPYTSDAERQAAFPDWLDWYNFHRPHTGINGHTPASRVTNLSGQHT
ncbi:IS481 family transposase [Streptomyces curacoi]|uniref:IS481 family transposase n=1 Tax=Streptomyces curacoi TaxID=146536 RepID=UPI003CC69662